jgi:hypothetical protein
MAFIPELDRVLLYAGVPGNWTWTYDSVRDNWSLVTPPGVQPEKRVGADMVYDEATGRVVLFGGVTGFEGTAPLRETNSTWTYDPRNNAWQNVTPPVSPPPRFYHRMAYDALAQRVVLFGGFQLGCKGFCIPETPDIPLNDTWLYDGRNNTWTNVTPPHSPSARAPGGLAYDLRAQKTLLFGGSGPSQYDPEKLYGDTWLFDAVKNQWTCSTASSPLPAPRGSASMAYDPAAGAIVLFGGVATSALNDTWWYRAPLDSWTRVPSPRSPTPRSYAGMAFDRRTSLLVLFGGVSYPWSTPDDTWLYHFLSTPLVPSMDVSPLTGTTPLNVSFHGEAVGGLAPYAFSWDFGDQSRTQGQDTSHIYNVSGNFTVTLRVLDTAGQNVSIQQWVVVAAAQAPPTLGIATMAFYGLLVVAAAASVATAILLRWRRSRID